jgi:hypothetical protein
MPYNAGVTYFHVFLSRQYSYLYRGLSSLPWHYPTDHRGWDRSLQALPDLVSISCWECFIWTGHSKREVHERNSTNKIFLYSFLPRSIQPRRKTSWYSMNRRLGGTQSRFGHYGLNKKLLQLSGIELWFLDRPTLSLLSILLEIILFYTHNCLLVPHNLESKKP